MIDSKNDFIHARRCIAAILASADKLLDLLNKCEPKRLTDLNPITMRLMTNDKDRGLIRAQPNNNRKFDVTVTIGVGNNRVDDSLPKNEWKWSRPDFEVYDYPSQMERSLAIIQSIGGKLLEELPE